MRWNWDCCHISLAFVLEFLNFLPFVGISIILYSVWMLDHWENHIPISPPPSAPSPDSSSLSLFFHSEYAAVSYRITPLDFAVDLVSGIDGTLGLDLHSFKRPPPWVFPLTQLVNFRVFDPSLKRMSTLALSLLLVIVLRAMFSTRRVDYNGEDDYNGRATTREPLLNPQLSRASGSTKVDSRGLLLTFGVLCLDFF